jgi:predicted component of type VI protein secretion system
MKSTYQIIAAAIATSLLAVGCATSSKPSKTVSQVMEEGFKGKESLNARISKGEASAADFKLMASLTKELAKNKPGYGDLASWTEKTTALHAAAEGLVAGKPGALDAYKAASNCKACHSAHRPPEKH